MIWNPPESVRIARFQPMNAWSPPARRIVSLPRPRHEVVRVGENGPAVPLLQPVELDSLHGAASSDRQEARRLDVAMVGRQDPAPRGRRRVSCEDLEREHGKSRVLGARSVGRGHDLGLRTEN